MINLRTYKMFYPMTILVDLDSSRPVFGKAKVLPVCGSDALA